MNWPERQAFWQWWREAGSGILPIEGHDMSDHAERVAEIAWANAVAQNRAAEIYRKALEMACGHIVACGVHDVSCEIANCGQVGQCMQEFVEWAESICRMTASEGPEMQKQAMPDARLISAAPLMYQALEEVSEAFDDGEVDYHIIEIVRDALKAAKGGDDGE